MPAHKRLPDNDTLLQLLNQNWTYQQIADRYGVTTQAVFLAARRIPGATQPRPTYKEELPWALAKEHHHARPAAYLRSLGRRRANVAAGRPVNEGLTEKKANALDRWLEGLERDGQVVIYDRRIPPNPASSSGGFAYVPRLPSDNPELPVRPPVIDLDLEQPAEPEDGADPKARAAALAAV
jgi:hypothetical protein